MRIRTILVRFRTLSTTESVKMCKTGGFSIEKCLNLLAPSSLEERMRIETGFVDVGSWLLSTHGVDGVTFRDVIYFYMLSQSFTQSDSQIVN